MHCAPTKLILSPSRHRLACPLLPGGIPPVSETQGVVGMTRQEPACRRTCGGRGASAFRKGVSLVSAAAIASLSITSATAAQYPGPKKRYLSGKKLELCDQGSFFVGGVLKTTNYTSVPATATPQTVTLGQMYVSFQIPAKYRDYPVIMISGGGHTGACLEIDARRARRLGALCRPPRHPDLHRRPIGARTQRLQFNIYTRRQGQAD